MQAIWWTILQSKTGIDVGKNVQRTACIQTTGRFKIVTIIPIEALSGFGTSTASPAYHERGRQDSPQT